MKNTGKIVEIRHIPKYPKRIYKGPYATTFVRLDNGFAHYYRTFKPHLRVGMEVLYWSTKCKDFIRPL